MAEVCAPLLLASHNSTAATGEREACWTGLQAHLDVEVLARLEILHDITSTQSTERNEQK